MKNRRVVVLIRIPWVIQLNNYLSLAQDCHSQQWSWKLQPDSTFWVASFCLMGSDGVGGWRERQPNFELWQDDKQLLGSKLPSPTTPKGRTLGWWDHHTEPWVCSQKRMSGFANSCINTPLDKGQACPPLLTMLRAQSRHWGWCGVLAQLLS